MANKKCIYFYLKARFLLEEVLNLAFLKVQRVDSILEGKRSDNLSDNLVAVVFYRHIYFSIS